MNTNPYITIHVGEEMFKGQRSKVVSQLEAIGYQVERENNPAEAHKYFQAAENQKRQGKQAQ